MKPLPKFEPRGGDAPKEGENPFTLPAARLPNAAPQAGSALPPAKSASAPDAEPPPAIEKKPAEEKPKPAAAPPKEGFGARFLRSFRGDPAAPPSKPVVPEPKQPDEPAMKKEFSLPPARLIEPEPVKEAPPAEPPRAEKPQADPPRRFERYRPPVNAPKPEEPEIADLDEKPSAPPREESAPPAAEEVPPPRSDEADEFPAPEASRTGRRDGPGPGVVENPAPPGPAAPPQAAAAAGARNSPVYIAAIAGAALGTVSVLAVYLLLRPDTSPGTSPSANSPFTRDAAPAAPASAPAPVAPTPAPPMQSPPPLIDGPSSSPAPVAPGQTPPAKSLPAPKVGGPISAAPPPPSPAVPPPDATRPTASFGDTPRFVMTEPPPPPPAPKAAPAPADDGSPDAAPPAKAKAKAVRAAAPTSDAVPARPRKPKGPAWAFEGMVFDLLTARGVFAAKLIFLDADGNVAAQTETGPGGRYKISVPAGDEKGYELKIVAADYTERYIDEGDSTSSLREATPEERRILMSAAARNLPWVGNTKKAVHRDLALVPESPEEP